MHDDADTHLGLADYLTGLAYRITGSQYDAQDIVQEAFVRWHASDNSAILSQKAWLTRIVTNLSLDHIKSAKIKRTEYVGDWLPEPFVSNSETPESIASLDYSVSMAFMVLLEGLSATERVAFILYEVFDFSYKEIAEILDRNSMTCRQQVSRAKKKLREREFTSFKNKEDYHSVVSAFNQAVETGNVENIITLLSDDVVITADSGGKVAAIRKSLQGISVVSEFIINVIAPNFRSEEGTYSKVELFNGLPGILLYQNNQLVSAYAFEVKAGKIEGIYAHRNPDKLSLFNYKNKVSHWVKG